MMDFRCLKLTDLLKVAMRHQKACAKIVILKGVAGITTPSKKLILASIFGPLFRQLNLREFLEFLNWRNVPLTKFFPNQAYCIVHSIYFI